MQEHQLPELQRCPLEELCLVARLVDPGVSSPLAAFLAKAPEPPLPQAADLAVQLLQDIGALTPGEELTTLGRHLAALPLPPQLGKLILYGLLFRCLEPVITVACAMSYRCVSWRRDGSCGGRRCVSSRGDECNAHAKKRSRPALSPSNASLATLSSVNCAGTAELLSQQIWTFFVNRLVWLVS